MTTAPNLNVGHGTQHTEQMNTRTLPSLRIPSHRGRSGHVLHHRYRAREASPWDPDPHLSACPSASWFCRLLRRVACPPPTTHHPPPTTHHPPPTKDRKQRPPDTTARHLRPTPPPSESMLDTFYNCTGSKTSVVNIIVLFLRHPEHDLVSKVNAISIRYFARFALGSDSPPLVTRGGDKGECSAPRKRKVMKRRGLHDVTLHRSSFNSHAEEGKRHGFA